MGRLIIYLYMSLMITVPFNNNVRLPSGDVTIYKASHHNVTAMEALDLVKEHYAANFDKIYQKNSKDEYYYKLMSAEYYLVYEGRVGTNQDYLIHLYEFVVDDPDSGLGHTVTYGWYTVDQWNGRITEYIY